MRLGWWLYYSLGCRSWRLVTSAPIRTARLESCVSSRASFLYMPDQSILRSRRLSDTDTLCVLSSLGYDDARWSMTRLQNYYATKLRYNDYSLRLRHATTRYCWSCMWICILFSPDISQSAPHTASGWDSVVRHVDVASVADAHRRALCTN